MLISVGEGQIQPQVKLTFSCEWEPVRRDLVCLSLSPAVAMLCFPRTNDDR